MNDKVFDYIIVGAGSAGCVLANRRRVPPFGLKGGAPGALGRNWVERSDGSRQDLTGTDQAELQPGDVFVIETPGGGGYGNAA